MPQGELLSQSPVLGQQHEDIRADKDISRRKPFVPADDERTRAERCEEILTIQAMGLKKRLAHTHAKTAVVGISGGLDSTLALLVTARAFDMLGRDKKEIIAVTMPCFGTTDRTYNNACDMARKTGATLQRSADRGGGERSFPGYRTGSGKPRCDV